MRRLVAEKRCRLGYVGGRRSGALWLRREQGKGADIRTSRFCKGAASRTSRFSNLPSRFFISNFISIICKFISYTSHYTLYPTPLLKQKENSLTSIFANFPSSLISHTSPLSRTEPPKLLFLSLSLTHRTLSLSLTITHPSFLYLSPLPHLFSPPPSAFPSLFLTFPLNLLIYGYTRGERSHTLGGQSSTDRKIGGRRGELFFFFFYFIGVFCAQTGAAEWGATAQPTQ